MFPRHRRPINPNNNTLAVFPLPCIRKVLRIDSWFHFTTIFSTNIAASIFYTRFTSLFTSSAASSLTHFPLSPRSDDENYDVGAILHQCYKEYIVRFFIETIVCIINAFKARSSVFESRQKLTHVYQSYRETSNIYDVISYIMTSSPWRSLFAWRVTYVYSNIIVYQKYLVTYITVGCATCSLHASSGPKTKGVPTNNQRGQGSAPCRFWWGLDKASHIVLTALLVRVQRLRNDLYKTVKGPSTRPIVFSMIAGSYWRRRRFLLFSSPTRWNSFRLWPSLVFRQYHRRRSGEWLLKIRILETILHQIWTEVQSTT